MAEIVTKEGRLVKYGDSLALLFEPDLLEQMKIKPDTRLDIVTDGDFLVVSVHNEEHKAKLHQIMEEMRKEYSKVFWRLSEQEGRT
jgi:antitoxin component of MazEF toxin-antitoxin module